MELGMRLDDVVLSSTICLGRGIEPLKLKSYRIGSVIEETRACAMSCPMACHTNCSCQGNCSCVDDTYHSVRRENSVQRYEITVARLPPRY